jgi:hypothetical protein
MRLLCGGSAQLGQQRAIELDIEHESEQSVVLQQPQAVEVVDIEAGPTDEGQIALAADLHRRHVVGLDPEVPLRGQVFQRAQFGLGLDQREG